MKLPVTKKLLDSILALMLIFFGLIQFVNAQSCPPGKVWACRYCRSNVLSECKCVEEKNLANWIKDVHSCRLQFALASDTINESNVFEDCSHLTLNSNKTALLWSQDNNSDKIIKNKPGKLYTQVMRHLLGYYR